MTNTKTNDTIKDITEGLRRTQELQEEANSIISKMLNDIRRKEKIKEVRKNE